MECPRCGFQQPPDRYCANCGLDIESYLRRPEPWAHRLRQWLKSPIFYVILTLALVIVATASIRKIIQKSQTSAPTAMAVPSNDVAQSPPQPPPPSAASDGESDTDGEEGPSSSATKGEVLAAQSQALAQLSAEAESTTSGLVESPTPGPVAEGSLSEKSAFTPAGYRLEFFEVGREDLAQIFAQSKIVSDTPHARIMSSDKNKIGSLLATASKLGGGAQSTLQQPLLKNFAKDHFVVDIRSKKSVDEPTALIVRLVWNMGKPDEALVDFNATLTENGYLLIAGLLPHQTQDKPASPEGPLQILSSPDFQQSESEFLITLSLY